VALGVVGVAAFVGIQRAGLLTLIEKGLARLHRVFPSIPLESLRGLHKELMRRQQDRTALLKAAGLHLLSWMLGAAEVSLVMYTMGNAVSPPQAFVIESMGMAARSAGFAIPGALGIQEGGFILVCGLFGLPADIAVALSMVKRLRELMVGISALATWHWSEIAHKFSPRPLPLANLDSEG
jgi:uncharacterized membrane protein YbhN (UPF0104 family)